MVTGHTPTQGIMGNPKPGYVYRENHHIAIDCGCNRRNGRLAAVCLDTGREYYVENLENKVVGNGLLHNRRLSCTF